MKTPRNSLTRPKRRATPKQKAFVAFILAAFGIAAGVVYFIPAYENVGTLFTMLCAVLAGIFYTRYMKYKRGEAEDR